VQDIRKNKIVKHMPCKFNLELSEVTCIE